MDTSSTATRCSQPSVERRRIDGIRFISGESDFLLRIVAADFDAYRTFQIDHLTRIRGVQNVKTEIPMQKVKLTSELPVS